MKKIISILLTVTMLFSTFTLVFADDEVLISTASELKAFAAAINADATGGEGKVYKLTADIDLGGEPWSNMIGSASNPFKGTFDGNGKVVSNFKINATEDHVGYGLFGTIGGNASISKVGIKNVSITLTTPWKYEPNAGGLVGEMNDNATVTECYAKNVAYALGWTDTSIEGQFGDAGGLVGQMNGNTIVDSCYSIGYVYARTDRDGGLVGGAYDSAIVRNSYSDTTLVRCITEVSAKAVSNSYFIQTPDWPFMGNTANTYPGTQVTVDQLRTYHTTLGDAFVEGIASNGGLPSFAWEPVPAAMTGTGSEEDPYLIANLDNLLEVATMTDTDGKYFELTADIDVEGNIFSTYIGSSTNPFKGIFDGKGHIIKNYKLYVANSNTPTGLFGVVGGDAEIKNIGAQNVTFDSAPSYNSMGGGLIGAMLDNASLSNSYIRGVTVVYTRLQNIEIQYFGGLVGYTDGDGVTVSNCYSTSVSNPIDGTVDYDAGIVGCGENFNKIENCYSTYNIVRTSNANAEKVVNTYFSGSYFWPHFDDNTPELYPGSQVTAAELKASVEALGEAFKAGGMENAGFPALAWEDVSEVVISEGTGTAEDPYLIRTASNLLAMTYITDTEGVHFKLMEDVDLGGITWDAYIGSETNPFKGDFNGNGHVIKNYELIGADRGTHGLFCVTAGRAHIYDLGVEDITCVVPNGSWSAKVGGLVGVMTENSALTRCYAKNVNFEAGWNITGRSQGELYAGGGLAGMLNGAGVELCQCYAIGVDRGIKDVTIDDQPTQYHLIDKEGGVAGIAQSFTWAGKLFSDTYVFRYNQNIWVEDSYQTLNPTEWDTGYSWPWISNVNYIGYGYNTDYYITPGNAVPPKFKWENYDGKYLNLVHGGSMSISDSDAATLFGIDGAKIVTPTGRASLALEVPSSQSFKYDVDLEEGEYYRVSFVGRTKSTAAADGGFTFKLGDKDLTADLTDVDLSSDWNWDTKVVFVKADTTGPQTLEISGNEDLYIDDVSVYKVDIDYEKLEASECLNMRYNKLDTVSSNIYVQKKICDGLEVSYTSEHDFFDNDGHIITANLPSGLGRAADRFTGTVKFGDFDYSEYIDVMVRKRAPYEIKNVGLVDADGNTVYNVPDAAKIAEIKVVENDTEADAKLIAAVYADGKLSALKVCTIADGVCNANMDIPAGADKVKLYVVADGNLEPLALPEESFDTLGEDSTITIHTVGDSICATYAEEDVLKGWGQKLQQFFDADHVVVDNSLSRGGMSAMEFVENNERLATLIPKLKKNDVVIIQLSHNDQSKGSTEEFQTLLRQIIDSAREKGAIPMVLTSPVTTGAGTDTLGADGKYVVNSVLSGFPEAFKELAAECNLPVVDLYEHTRELFATNGYTGVINMGIYATDTVHFTSTGANYIANFLAKGIKDLNMPISQFVIAE